MTQEVQCSDPVGPGAGAAPAVERRWEWGSVALLWATGDK